MVTVMLMEFDSIDRSFNALKLVELAGVPTKDDKIAINDDQGIDQLYRVYDVHYSETGVDVNIIRLGTVTEYYSSKYLDIHP